MSKKISKVFLNATDDQIKEYGLDEYTNFKAMADLIAAVKADLGNPKVAERKYDLSRGFTVVDGAANASVDLTAIAKKNAYSLSAIDFDKIISEATKVIYASDSITDHRIASFKSVGEGTVTGLNPQSWVNDSIERSWYAATGAGEAEYEKAIAEAQENAVSEGAWSNSAIVGYKNLTIKNSGRTAAVTTKGEKMERVATITVPTSVSAYGGETNLDYQLDSTKAVDKKDDMLVVEKLTEKVVKTTVAAGKITVSDSQVGELSGTMTGQVHELAKLHPNEDFEDFVYYDEMNAAGYEDVTIDNSTVLGSIVGGSRKVEENATGSQETFLDKPDLSGQFYAVDEAAPNLYNQPSSDNAALYSYVESFVMTEEAADAKAKALGATKVEQGKKANLQVNKYEIVELGLDNGGEANFDQIKTGKYVYLTWDEFDALSSANQQKLAYVEVEDNVGRANFAGRQVTDENFTTFDKAPAGNALNETWVYKYEFTKTEDGKDIPLGTYYLTGYSEAEIVKAALEGCTGYDRDSEDVGYRAAESGSITAENFKTEAGKDKVYPAYSEYAKYTFTKEMTAEEAAEANKALMAADDQQAWIKGEGNDEKVLFAVEKISGGKEVAYYLTAAELSALGAFGKDADGKNVVKTVGDMDVEDAFDAATGWVFVDPEDRRAADADGNLLYRAGNAATETTLDNFKELSETNSSAEQPSSYELMDVVYGDEYYYGQRLLDADYDGFEAYLGENGEYVIDGKVQYRAAGYNLSGNIQGDEHVTADKKTFNEAEFNYSASIGVSLTEAEADEEWGAYLRDGELTQNKRIFKDAYVAEGEKQYITLDAEQDAYVHNFIDVYAAQEEFTSDQLLNGYMDGLDTGIQAKDAEGKALYLKYNVAGRVTAVTDETADNVKVSAYKDGEGRIYAVTAAEATNLGLTKVEGEGAKDYYRTYKIADGEATLENSAVDTLEQKGELPKEEKTNLEACNKVVAVYGQKEWWNDYSARLTVMVYGKEVPAFYDAETKQLTAEAKDKDGNDRMEAWYAEEYVIGQQVYKYTLEGENAVYFMTEAEAANVDVEGKKLTRGDAVEGVVHYGELATGATDIKNYTDDKTRVLDRYNGLDITKDAEGVAQQAVAEGGVIYSNIGGDYFAGRNPEMVNGRFVYYKSIDAEPTYFYTVDDQKSYSDLELDQLAKNESDAGIATWKMTVDKNGLMTWTRTAATGEVSTYTADSATVVTAQKGNRKDREVATGKIVVKNGSDVKGGINGYKDVTVQDSKVSDVMATDVTSERKSDFSTKKGKIGKDDRQTITTTEASDIVKKVSAIGSFTLANAADRLDEGGQIEQSARYVSGYETVKVSGANVGDFSVRADEFKASEKTVTDYTGDVEDLRADYVEDWWTLANTGREGEGEASYVVSKVTSETSEYKSKSAAVGSFEATGRDYTFDVADKKRANTIGWITGYDKVTLTNVNVDGFISSNGKSEYTDKSSYSVKTNAKTGKDAVTNSGNGKSVSDSAGTLVAKNTVTDAKNENDLTIASINHYQSVTLDKVGVMGDIWSTQKSTFTENGSVTEELDASTMRQVNTDGSQKYWVSGWSMGAYADESTWDFQNSKITSAKYTSKDVSAPDAVLKATGQFSTRAVENEAALNKYTQASTGRALYLTENEAESLIGDKSAESGLKAGWTKDEAQFYARRTKTNGAQVLDYGLGNLSGTIETSKYTNGKKFDEPEYEEYFFTADEAKVAMLADSTLKLATGDEASKRLRSSDWAEQYVTDNTAYEPWEGIIGTTEVRKYTKEGEAAYYLTADEFDAGNMEGGDYFGYELAEADEDTWFVRKASAEEDKSDYSCFAKDGADKLYAFTNKFDESVRYATQNEFDILVADGQIVADDYTKGETMFAYRAADNAAVWVGNYNCTDSYNKYAAQKASTVFKYDRTDKATSVDGADSYYVTAQEFAALSGKDGVLEGYALDEETFAKSVLRYETAKAATKDNIGDFQNISNQGRELYTSELYRTELTDEAAAQLGIVYDEQNLRAYSANGADEWADAVKTTVNGDIRNFKTVALDTMTVNGLIDNGHDTKSDSSISYSKKLAAKKGSDVYTEKFSSKSNSTENAVGSIELVDTDVLDGVVGYDKVSISTKEATSTIGGIQKRYATSKYTSDVSVVTTDAPAYFSQEKTDKSTDVTTSTAKGDLKVEGRKAAEKLVIDQVEHFDDWYDAYVEARKQIADFGERKDADIRITSDISGFTNVSLKNVTLTSSTIDAYSEKANSSGGQTRYTLTNNDDIWSGNTATVVTALNESYTYSNTIGGNLDLTNVNLEVTYSPTYERQETPDAAEVNTYRFNGKYYALTAEEQAALLPYADYTEGWSQARLNASVKKPATEVVEGQSILTVRDFGKAEIANDRVYYKTSKVVDPEAEDKTYYYVRAEQVNAWLATNEGEEVDTSVKFYSDEYGRQITNVFEANVSKYTYDGTTVYLTAEEAEILGATATKDTAKYTRLSRTQAAITKAGVDPVKKEDGSLVEFYKYIGTDATGKKEYYLTEDEFKGFKDEKTLNDTFGKVDDTKYQRIDSGIVPEGFKKEALDAIERGEHYYLKGETIFTKAIDENLNDYQAVNESAEVFKVSNNLNGEVIGYLTKAEYFTLRDTAAAGVEAFDEIYGIDTGTKYLRVADDTNNLVKINGVEGEGYVVEAEDTLKPYGYYVAAERNSHSRANADGFKAITMVDSALSGADGSLTTEKTSAKLTSKKDDDFGNYSATENFAYKYNVGTFKAVEGVNNVYGHVSGYKTVTLEGDLDDEGTALSTFGSFTSGTETVKNSYSGKVELADTYYVAGDIYAGKTSEQTTATSDGTFDAKNVTLGTVQGYKDVKIAFEATDDEEVRAKHTVGSITGGNSDVQTTSTIKTVGGVKIVDRTTTEKLDAVGTVTVDYADAGDIEGFEKVNVTGSDVGTVSGGKFVTKTIVLEMTRRYTTTSYDITTEFTAFGTATLEDSKADSVTGFNSVAFADGVEVAGDVYAVTDSDEKNPSRGEPNTVCYAVTYGYNYARKAYDNTVYLTLDEYKAFVKNEDYADAQIDLSASTYREAEATENPTADDAYWMADEFTDNTAEAKRYTEGKGYNGANPDKTIVKAYGQDVSIDESGAKIGGMVGGYQKVTVDGDSSFGKGYEGTQNADTLVVNADLHTFDNLDFGDGNDTLELNGTFGTNVEFKDWNLEEVKGKGTMVVKKDDVDAVQEKFADIKVYGSDNYSAGSALEGLTKDEAIDLYGDREEWLGFGNETDFFKAQTDGKLTLDGEIFDAGVATAKVSYDKGETWKAINDGDEIYEGADVKVFLDADAKNKVSNDYTISIA